MGGGGNNNRFWSEFLWGSIESEPIYQACQTQIAVQAAKSVSIANNLLVGRIWQNVHDSFLFLVCFSSAYQFLMNFLSIF